MAPPGIPTATLPQYVWRFRLRKASSWIAPATSADRTAASWVSFTHIRHVIRHHAIRNNRHRLQEKVNLTRCSRIVIRRINLEVRGLCTPLLFIRPLDWIKGNPARDQTAVMLTRGLVRDPHVLGKAGQIGCCRRKRD